VKETINISNIPPASSLVGMPVLTTESERYSSLTDWKQPVLNYPRDACIPQLFEAQVEHSPEALALEWSGGRLTYQELNEWANQLARHLRMLKVGVETLVGVHVGRSAEFVVSVLAILKAGGAYVPLDTDYPVDRLQFLLADSGAPVVISDQPLPQELKFQGITLVDLTMDVALVGAYAKNNLDLVNTAENLAYVIYTSGSTGQPKGVAIPHRGVVRLVRGQDYVGFDNRQRFLMLASTSFDAATFELWGPLLNGAVCVIFPKSPLDFQQLEGFIRRHQITCLWLTAGLFNQIISVRPSVLETVGHVLAGGDTLSPVHVQKALELLPALQLTNGYGPTESTTFACCHAIRRGEIFPNGSVPIGRPIAHTQCYLFDDQLAPVPPGVPGELHIGGDGLARGYWNRPELTAEKFIANPFSREPETRLYKTGDLARQLPDGNLEFLGRIDQQVKIRGFRIEPGEIEFVLGRHPGVRECVVMARADTADGTKTLAAYLVVSAEPAPTVAELREFLLAKLPDYMVPAAFVVLAKLPLTPNGKVDRKALPAPDENRLASGMKYVAPRTPTETALAKVWCELLDVERIGIHDNFFTLGGHSLIAVRMLFRIHNALGVDLPVNAVLKNPTLAALSMVVDGTTKGGNNNLIQNRPVNLPRPGSGLPAAFPVSFNQQQLWFIDQLDSKQSVYNIPLVIRMKGRLDQVALQKSLNHLIQRHEVLRTTFYAENGEPVQVIAPKLEIELPVVDLKNHPEPRREAEVQQILRNAAGRQFDLSCGPLIRSDLLNLEQESHILIVTIHHIVFDGWSVDVLLRELMAGYATFCEGRPPHLPELPIQYADFAAWQRRLLCHEVLEEQLFYWKRQLGGGLPVLELPSDHARPAAQTFHGAGEVTLLPKALAERLQNLSQQEGGTLFMTLLAAFKILLHRYTAQDDVIVGSPNVVRNHAETEGLIGFFVNVLVLRADLSGNPSFKELFRRVRKICLEAYAHQDVPFEKLVEHLQPERRQDRNPLFQVMLNLLNFPDFHCDLPDLKVELTVENGLQSKFDMTLYVTPTSQGIQLNLVYNADLFASARMVEMLAQYQQLLEQIVDQPDEKINGFNLVTPAVRMNLPDPAQQLGFEWMESVPARFSAMAQRTPRCLAVADPNDQWTYQELEKCSNQLAHYLSAQNVNQSDVVAIYGHRSASLVWAMLGTWKAGAAFVILDPAHPPGRLQECVRMAKPKAWLQLTVAGPLPEGLEKLAAGLPCRLEVPTQPVAAASNFLEKYPVAPPAICIGPDDLAYIAFTSGSTGSPKGVLGSHRPLSHFFQWHSEHFGLTSADRFSMLSGLSHDPLLRDVFTALWVGAAVHIPEPVPIWEPKRLKAWLQAAQITVMHLAPSLGQLLAESGDAEKLPALRHIFFGGDALRRQLIDKLQNLAPGATFVNFYGTTETPQGVGYYLMPVGVAGKNADSEMNQCEVMPVGKGIHGVQLLILNAAEKLAGIGELGQICVRTPYLSNGYLDNKALTREQFPINSYTDNQNDHYYKTGDLGRYLPDGNVELLGRNDAQVKIRGYRIEPGEIEATLATHPRIANAVVTARQDKGDDKNLAAYLVARDGAAPTATELRAFLLQRLPDYMVPSVFVTLEKLPLTPNGKIDRQALPVPAEHRIVLENEFIAPRTPTETALAQIWRALLGVEQIGVHENFFAAGGHSLMAVRMVNQIKQQMNFDLPLRMLFQHPSIHELAQILPAQKTQAHQPELILLQDGRTGPEVFFLIDEGSLGLFKLAHFLSKDRRLYGSVVPLPEATLRAAAKKQFSALPRMEDLAAEHVTLIRKHQPGKPVLLAGHCFGGMLAFEVAHQLQAVGIPVAAVLLLDTWMMHPPCWWERKAWLREHLGNLLRHGPGYLWRKSRRRISLEKDELASRLKLAIHDNFNVYVPLTVITRIYRHAVRGYQPKPLAGRGLLFLSQDDWLANAYRPIENSLGADRFFTGNVEVINVPGDHVTVLDETHLPELAEKFNQCLEQFQDT